MHTKTYKDSCAIRDSYRILPLQGVWTWLTGKEINGRSPLWRSSSLEMLFWSLLWCAGGTTLSSYALGATHGCFVDMLLYSVGVLFSVSGARYVVATIIHHGVHGHLTRKPIVNQALCEVLSTFLIVQPYESYRRFHVYEHHGRDFSTLNDKDLAAIYKLGFTPGKSKGALYRNLVITLLNPAFHLTFFWGRLKSNLVSVRLYRLCMSVLWLISLAVFAAHFGALFFVAIVVVPYVVVYQAASLLHLLTEHVWLLRLPPESVRESHVRNSLGRFCGSACPAGWGIVHLVPWLKWSIAHLFFHLPCRMLIVQGSLVCHDWHHRFGSTRQWHDYAALREADAVKLVAEGRYDYTEIWGFDHCLDHVFERLSASDAVHVGNLNYRLN
ncbi:hypothetical protein [Paraburkholderia xenovorans]